MEGNAMTRPVPWSMDAISRHVRWFYTIAAVCLLGGALQAAEEKQAVIVVIGAAGTPEFGEMFRVWGERWKAAAEQGEADFTWIGFDESGEDRSRLQQALEVHTAAGKRPLWLVLIGHGTFDGKTARFNLRGPDVSSSELATWIKPIERPLAFIDCTSCSGAFLAELSGTERVIVTATRSGNEYNFARLGDSLSAAVADPSADLDKDDQTSLLEAFVLSAAKVREFYSSESRLATEHALIDDNGDRLGTPAEWFRGVKAVKSARTGAAVDGDLARQFVLVRSTAERALPEETRIRRDELERELAALRERKEEMSEEEYLGLIEPLLIELGGLYGERANGEPGSRE
jgi:hypothetical protein